MRMKLVDIPINTLVELQFVFMGEKHKVCTGLLYNINSTIYVSAIKNSSVVIQATKLKKVALSYKTEAGIYTFSDLSPRSISYNGQNLYAMNSDQEAQVFNHRKSYRLFVGVRITAKIIEANGETSNLYCVLKDLSMTGMGIVSNQRLDKLSKIEISFRVNQKDKETLLGNIIHIHEFANGNGFLYGCEFDQPSDSIARFVARKQDEMNAMGQGDERVV